MIPRKIVYAIIGSGFTGLCTLYFSTIVGLSQDPLQIIIPGMVFVLLVGIGIGLVASFSSRSGLVIGIIGGLGWLLGLFCAIAIFPPSSQVSDNLKQTTALAQIITVVVAGIAAGVILIFIASYIRRLAQH